MNYRHAYHAGNFAEVVKHAVLARVVAHLRDKPAPFRLLDTHAGAGLTDLAGPEARRTGEWRDGIARPRAAWARRPGWSPPSWSPAPPRRSPAACAAIPRSRS